MLAALRTPPKTQKKTRKKTAKKKEKRPPLFQGGVNKKDKEFWEKKGGEGPGGR